MRCRSMLAASFTVFALAGATADSNWPQFRGSQAGIAADDPALPETWSSTENIGWKADVPGVGWGSPVVWGDHIFLTSAVNTERNDRPALKVYTAAEVAPTTAVLRWVVYDFDFKTGKLRWEREVARGVPSQAKHMKNSYASETPATDGDRVYAYFGGAGLFAFDMNGKAIWSRPMKPMKMRSGTLPGDIRSSAPTTRRQSSSAITTTRCTTRRSSPVTMRGPEKRSTDGSASASPRGSAPRRGPTTERSSR